MMDVREMIEKMDPLLLNDELGGGSWPTEIETCLLSYQHLPPSQPRRVL